MDTSSERKSVILDDLPDQVAPSTHLRAEAGLVITIFIAFL
ncbi:MAG: hypothetical protein WBE65_02950 [Steroidobacteraceae bacterium]